MNSAKPDTEYNLTDIIEFAIRTRLPALQRQVQQDRQHYKNRIRTPSKHFKR